jgi:hypothetical protein
LEPSGKLKVLTPEKGKLLNKSGDVIQKCRQTNTGLG